MRASEKPPLCAAFYIFFLREQSEFGLNEKSRFAILRHRRNHFMPATTTDLKEATKILCELAQKHINPEKIKKTRERHAAMFDWKDADYIPLPIGADAPAELEGIPSFPYLEHFHDPEKYFVTHMKAVVSGAVDPGDRLLTVKAAQGELSVPSIFGIEYTVMEYSKACVTRRLFKEEVRDFEVPDDISCLGLMPKVVENSQYHMELLKEYGLEQWVSLNHCDKQGPYDIAFLIRGESLFIDMYEDPEFVHELMNKCTDAYIKASLLCRKLDGDSPFGNASGNWMSKGAVRACDDSCVLISKEIFDEFSKPYLAKAFAELGGGWVHYCGGDKNHGKMEGIHHHDSYCDIPDLHGLNFSTGYDLDYEIKKLISNKVNFIGGIQRIENEPLDVYFRRALSYCSGRQGLFLGLEINPDERSSAMSLWHRLQDEMLPEPA